MVPTSGVEHFALVLESLSGFTVMEFYNTANSKNHKLDEVL
jgi:hypothetical protein